MMKYILIVVALLAIGGGVYWWYYNSNTTDYEAPSDIVLEDQTDDEMNEPSEEGESNEEVPTEREPREVIGLSATQNEIEAFHFGDGDKEILFVGGIHGGYAKNTVTLMHELIDYLEEDPSRVPEGVTVTIVPRMNPDGLMIANPTDHEDRFNGNGVDLNRNFDCEWQEEGVWQSKTVSGGDAPFSEPETQALRDYIQNTNPEAVVVYYTSAGGVYASNCLNGVLPGTTELMNAYADASGYPADDEFDFYEITGDMVNWVAKMNIPGISVLLTSPNDSEWTKNKAGIEAAIDYVANQ